MASKNVIEEETKYDYRTIEKKWQKKWKESNLFHSDIKENDSREKYFITVPYPYPNGISHIGHGRAFTGGDIFARYKRIRGYNVLFPLAFHITGTPVLATSTSVRNKDPVRMDIFRDYIKIHTKDKKKVEEILESFVDPWNVVKYFSKTMKKDFESVGYSIDWRRRFTTGDPEYNQFITWMFNKYKEKNYLTVGELGILYSLEDKNAVGEDDIQDGDTKDLSILEYSLMKFPFEDGYLVASTLRPETVFGATNIFVHPDATYVKVKIKKTGEYWYVAKNSVILLNHQKMEAEIINEFEGKEIFGKFAKNLVDDRKLPIIPGTFVDATMVTGVVYSVPGHAPFDWIAVKDFLEGHSENYGLNPEDYKEYLSSILMIDIEKYGKDFPAKVACEQHGVKTQNDNEKLEAATKQIYSDEFYGGVLNSVCGEFQGLKASVAKISVSKHLMEKNYYGILLSPAEKGLKSRSGGDVIVSIMDNQHFLWFSNEEWKKKATEALNNMTINPIAYRKLFENTFEWLDKRPCARRRGLGTRYPFQDENDNWIIESLSDSTIYMSFYTIIHIIRENKIKAEQLTQQFFDYIYLGKGTKNAVSKATQIDISLLNKMRTEFLYWYPLDHRHTAIMHISNHLSFFIFAHAAIFPKKHWPKKITLLEPLITEGEKMGKSKGNVISLADAANDFGVDLYRLYTANRAELDTVMNWVNKEVEVMGKHLRKIFDYFYNVEVFNKDIKYEKCSIFEKAFLNQFYEHITKAAHVMDNDELRKFSHEVFFESFNTIQKYNRLISNSNQYKQIMSLITDYWLIMASPVTPHLCEELWEHRKQEGFISVTEWPIMNENWKDTKSLAQIEILERTIEDIKSIAQALKISTDSVKEIEIIVADVWKYNLYNLAANFAKQNKLKVLIKEAMSDSTIKTSKNMKEIPKYAKKLQKPGFNFYDISQDEEFLLLNSSLDYIKINFPNAKIKIQKSNESKSNRANFAEPTRVAIDIKTS